MTRTTCGSEHRRFPRVADAGSQIAAVSDRRGDRFRMMMKVENEIGNAPRGQPLDDASGERLTVHAWINCPVML